MIEFTMSTNLDVKPRLVYVTDQNSLETSIDGLTSFILVVPQETISDLDNIKDLKSHSNYQILLSYRNKSYELLFQSYFSHKEISFLFPEDFKEKYVFFIELYHQLITSNSKNSFLDITMNNQLNLKFINHFTLKNSDERWACFDEIRRFTETLPCFSDFSNIIDVVASELITNSFYDAYRDPITNLSVIPNRKVSFSLPANHKIEVKIAVDNSYFWFYIKDSFGTLNKDTLFKALDRAASEKQVKLNSPGGAGIGLYMVFLWSTELYFCFNKNISTEILCKIKLTKRHKEFDQNSPFLTIIEKSN